MSSISIDVFRAAAYDLQNQDNVNLVLNQNQSGLTSVKERGGVNTLAGLFNIGTRATYGREMLDAFKIALTNVGKAKENNLTDDQCLGSINRAFTSSFGMDFETAKGKALKLNPKMLRTAIAAFDNEIRALNAGSFGGIDSINGQSNTKSVKSESSPIDDTLKGDHPLNKKNIEKFLGAWKKAVEGAIKELLPDLQPGALDGLKITSHDPKYSESTELCTNVKQLILGKKPKEISAHLAHRAIGFLNKAKARGSLEGVKLPSVSKLAKEIETARTHQAESKENWANIKKEFGIKSNDRSIKLTSKMTGGANLNNCDGKQLYAEEGVFGHASGDRRTSEITNVWQTELSVKTEGGGTKRIFSAIRHGVCSAYKLMGKKRAEAAVSRAEGLAKAAFLSRCGELMKGGNGDGSKTNPIKFNITNVALLTPTTLNNLNDEKGMVRDQRDAFKTINERGEPICVKVGGKDVYIKPNITMFNFAVNSMGTGKLGAVFSHTGVQNRINANGIKALRDHVNVYLESIKNQHDSDANYKRSVVTRLMHDVERMLANDSSLHTHQELYKAASRITVLAHMIGDIPSFNCKSGKDRTGHNDAEAKFLATLIELKMPIPQPGAKLTDEESRIFCDIALQSGNLEVQERNTGLGGYKTADMDDNIARLGDTRRGFYANMYKGGSAAVGS